MTNFEVGDRVRVIEEWEPNQRHGKNSSMKGKIGTIQLTDVHDENYPYRVVLDNGKQGWVNSVESVPSDDAISKASLLAWVAEREGNLHLYDGSVRGARADLLDMLVREFKLKPSKKLTITLELEVQDGVDVERLLGNLVAEAEDREGVDVTNKLAEEM